MQHESPAALPPASSPRQSVVRLAARHWRTLVACAVLGTVVSVIAAFLLPRLYEATAVIKIGQVGSKPLESPIQVVERIRLDGFLQTLDLPGVATVKDKQERISTRVVRGADLVEMKFRAPTREASAQGATRIFEALRDRHVELARPLVQRLDDQLRDLARKQEEARLRREKFDQDLRGATKGGAVRDEYPFFQLALVGQDNELARWEAGLRDMRSQPNTGPTHLIEAISVSERPVSPNRPRLAAAGLLGGILLGALLAWIRTRHSKA